MLGTTQKTHLPHAQAVSQNKWDKITTLKAATRASADDVLS